MTRESLSLSCHTTAGFLEISNRWLYDLDRSYYPLPTESESAWEMPTALEASAGTMFRRGLRGGPRSYRRGLDETPAGGGLVTALFNIEEDPTESNNLLVDPTPQESAVVKAILQKLHVLTEQSIPPGNQTEDGRQATAAAAAGGLTPWCAFDTEAACSASATVPPPDAVRVMGNDHVLQRE